MTVHLEAAAGADSALAPPGRIEAPSRLSVSTCAGCGAMSRTGTCDAGCAEHRLPLVRAEVVDAIADAEALVLAGSAALHHILEVLVVAPAPPEGYERAYVGLRSLAGATLAQPLDACISALLLDEPAAPAITWWCDRCGAVDAPQPCLGICVWRTVDWVRFDIYEELRQRAVLALEAHTRLRALVWRIAHTTPRPGQHARVWTAYREEAIALLADVASAAHFPERIHHPTP